MPTAIKVPVIESERGWGTKIDDYMICKDRETAEKFATDFNSKNVSDTAPDWYMQAQIQDATEVTISDSLMEALQNSEKGIVWQSIAKNL